MWFIPVVLFILKCLVAEKLPWWRDPIYYRILVDSFKDSDGDGLGDLQGIVKQLSYLRALGADAVILSPILTKSTDCNNPGTTDFIGVDERYGTIEKFNVLIEKAKKLELKVVVTLPVQTVSSVSELFNFSAERRVGYEDAIVWRDARAEEVPPAQEGVNEWTFNEKRGVYYGTLNKEVLVNICSEAVVAMFSDAQCMWITRGVSGVLLYPDFKDNQCGIQLVRKMASAAISCSRKSKMDAQIILVETSLGAVIGAKYYGEGGVGANSVLSHALTTPQLSAPTLAVDLLAATIYPPQDMAPTWITSVSNGSRIATRYGTEMVDAILLLALALPGAVVIQQGDELGAADTILEWADGTKCWPSEFAAASAPFPWDDTPTASFTSGTPWLPMAPNYRYANAKAEYANDLSHLGVMKAAAAIRKSPAMGPHYEITRLGDALAVLRWGGAGSILVIANLGPGQTEVLLSIIPGLPAEMTVAATSGSTLTSGTRVNLDKIFKLASGESALVVGPPRHCGEPGPVDKIANKLSEGWQRINKYFGNSKKLKTRNNINEY